MVKFAVIVALLLAGVGAWNIGNRLSNDAVSMLVGLAFGAAATMFPVILIASAWRRPTRPIEQPPPVVHVVMLPQPATRQLPAAPQTIDGTCSRYNVARPFDIVPAATATEWRNRNKSASHPDFFDDDDDCHLPARCANWQHCPDCGWPMQPDEHCRDWCGVAANGRRYAIVGEVE